MPTASGADHDGRFDIRHSLGAGGMGEVYRAFDRLLGREVALKILRHATGRDLYRFKREFRALADVVHPNLAQLYELHTVGDEWFFTMEVVEGVPFLAWVRSGHVPVADRISDPDVSTAVVALPETPAPRATRLDEPRLRAALPQLVEGVMALHVVGKLHRDLKPSNVLVTREGRVALLDFGLVSDVDTMRTERTHEAAAVGTPAYMSPEQAADLPLTEASDWYAVGVMLYEALTGQRPFVGGAEAQMRLKQVETPPAPSAVAPGVPPDLEQLCLALLAIDPAQRPDGAAILAALGHQPSDALTTHERRAVARPFVGRADELAALRAADDDARNHTVAVFVSGESGIGKSQLVRQFLDERAARTILLEGRCYERESVPYKTLDTIVDALTAVLLALPVARADALLPRDVGPLARLFPVLRRVPAIAARSLGVTLPVSPLELRTRAFASLRALLGRLAGEAPVVVAIDDLQWGDTDSAIFLADLIHDPEPQPMLLVLIHRPEDDGGVVTRVRDARGGPVGDTRAIAVGPLPDAEARQLVRAVGASDISGETIVRDAGGHPLFLAELARTARGQEGAPASFEDLIAKRVAALPANVAALLRTAAVAARPLPLDLAAAAAGITLDGSEVSILRAERLLRARSRGETELERVETYHDRVRSAVQKAIAPPALIAIHAALARACEAAGRNEDLEAVVAHWMAAGEPARAAALARRAAVVAEEALAFHRASALYALSLAHGSHDAAALHVLRRRHADALANAGQLRESVDALAEAARGADPIEGLELESVRIGHLLRLGMLDEGRDLSRRLLAPLGITMPTTRGASIRSLLWQMVRSRMRGLSYVERAEAEVPREVLHQIDLLATTATGLGVTEPIVGAVVQSHALRAALDAGEPRRLCMALSIELGYRGQAGTRGQRRIDDALAVLRPLAERVESPQARSLAAAMQGMVYLQLGRWKESRILLEAGLTMMRENVTGMRWELSVNEQLLVAALVYLGDVREVTRQVPRLYREAIDRGDSFARDGMRGWRGNVAWAYLGKVDEARRHALEVVAPLPRAEDVQIRHLMEMMSLVQLDLYERDFVGAKTRLDHMWPPVAASLLLRVQLLRIEAEMTRGRVLLAYAIDATGDERRATLRSVRAIAKSLARERAPWASALASMFRGVASRVDGNEAAALACLDEAERSFAAADMALFVDAVRLRRGQLEGGITGQVRVTAALASLRDAGIADPVAIARMLCPWPDDPVPHVA